MGGKEKEVKSLDNSFRKFVKKSEMAWKLGVWGKVI